MMIEKMTNLSTVAAPLLPNKFKTQITVQIVDFNIIPLST